MGIVGILAAIAVPSFRATIESNRRTAYANQLFEDLAFARSEAIKRGVRVVVCSSNAGTKCTDDIDWQVGWMVFADVNSDASFTSGETILKVHEALNLPSGWVAKANTTSGTYVSYRPLGNTQANFRVCMLPTADLSTCNDNGVKSLTKYTNLVITNAGRVRIESKG
jgi:type IV fimbrial biogenesis protein FimT